MSHINAVNMLPYPAQHKKPWSLMLNMVFVMVFFTWGLAFFEAKNVPTSNFGAPFIQPSFLKPHDATFKPPANKAETKLKIKYSNSPKYRYDLSQENEKKVEEIISKILSVYVGTFKLSLPDEVKIKIRLFRDYNGYEEYTMETYSPNFTAEGGVYMPEINEMILYKGDSVDDTMETIFHEASHSIIHRLVGDNTPTWLDEGLAEYFSMAELNGQQIQFRKKSYPLNAMVIWCRRQDDVLHREILSLEGLVDLSACNWYLLNDVSFSSSKQSKLYAMSWSIVYYLMSTEEGKRTIAHVLHDVKNHNSPNYSSTEAINRYYPGGLSRLQKNWNQWAMKEGWR